MPKPRGIIILEGADASGKTTLAAYLRDKHGARYLHGRVFPSMWRYHVAMTRLALRWADAGLVVIDRLWLSELVYGHAYRGGAAYDLGARCLDRVLQRTGAVTVLCAPEDQEHQIALHAERAGRGEEAFQSIKTVVALYADLVHGNLAQPGDGYLFQNIRFGDFASRRDVLVYDYARHTRSSRPFVNRILARIEDLRADQLGAALSSDRHNFTGNLSMATRALVGDTVSPQLNHLGPRGPRWPFCWHDGESAATRLNQALHKIGHDETSTVILNANDDDTLETLVERGEIHRFVALGARATDRLARLGVKSFEAVEHPQHNRRFHHSELDDYARRLEMAING